MPRITSGVKVHSIQFQLNLGRERGELKKSLSDLQNR